MKRATSVIFLLFFVVCLMGGCIDSAPEFDGNKSFYKLDLTINE